MTPEPPTLTIVVVGGPAAVRLGGGHGRDGSVEENAMTATERFAETLWHPAATPRPVARRAPTPVAPAYTVGPLTYRFLRGRLRGPEARMAVFVAGANLGALGVQPVRVRRAVRLGAERCGLTPDETVARLDRLYPSEGAR